MTQRFLEKENVSNDASERFGDKWKRELFEKVKIEIGLDTLDWGHFSSQVDNFVYTFGGGAYKDGRLPPHGKNEIWLKPLLEREIIKQHAEAMKRQNNE